VVELLKKIVVGAVYLGVALFVSAFFWAVFVALRNVVRRK
jgi:hypothetical protein